MKVGNGNLMLTPEGQNTIPSKTQCKHLYLVSLLERLPLVIFCHSPPAPLNKVIVSQSEEVYQGCGAHASLRGGGNEILHPGIIINHRDIELFLEGKST